MGREYVGKKEMEREKDEDEEEKRSLGTFFANAQHEVWKSKWLYKKT